MDTNVQQKLHNARTTSLSELVKMAGEGLYLEFGVHTGSSIRQIAAVTKNTVYGFDSFEGLPEAWNGLQSGHFSNQGRLPSVQENVKLIKGWFNVSLPEFAKEHTGNVAFMHIDCDLYSSTKTVFDTFKDRFVDGTIIAFDEIFAYGGDLWKHHEYKAFCEFLEETGWNCDCIGVYGPHQAGFRLFK